jgi:hypothetical protein
VGRLRRRAGDALREPLFAPTCDAILAANTVEEFWTASGFQLSLGILGQVTKILDPLFEMYGEAD